MKKILLVLVIGLMLVSIVSYAKPFNKGPLTKITFIHYKKGFGGKPGTECGNGLCEQGENARKCPADCSASEPEPDSTCYDLMSNGFKWKELPVNYVIDPDNSDGLSEEFVVNAITQGAYEWDSHTNAKLFGNYSIDYDSSWDNDKTDGRNEFVFGNYPKEGVIAVTVVWGYFRGPPRSREIVEFDIMFDTDFKWGDGDGDNTTMDLQNIATHEIGHGLGLDDLYETTCSAETMYGYSWEGDVSRRDLNDGDLAGLAELYG